MAAGQITLRSKVYQVVAFKDGAISRESSATPQLPNPPIRFTDFSGGLGGDRVPSGKAADPYEYTKFYKADGLDTRWPDLVTLGILAQDSMETGLEVLRAAVLFKNNYWGLWEDDTSTDILSRRYVGSTKAWTAGGNITVAGADKKVGLDLVAFKTHLIALRAEEDDLTVATSSDGVTWGDLFTLTSPLANNVTQNENINAGLLIEIAGDMVLIYWDEDASTITFGSFLTPTASFIDEAVDITSQDGPLGVVVMRSPDGYQKLYVLTREGLWEVDTIPEVWTLEKIYDTDDIGDYANVRRLVRAHGRLWIGLGGTDDESMRMTTAHVEEGQWVFTENMGLDGGFEVPSDMLGPSRQMVAAGGQLFVSMGGGAASRNSRILSCMGFDERGLPMWHPMYKNATANQEVQWIGVSARDDGVERLHFALRTDAVTSDTNFLHYPLTHPKSVSSTTIKRTVQGCLLTRRYDAGATGIFKIWLQYRVNAGNLSASNSGEYIGASHGVDGASRGQKSLGDFLSTVLKLDTGDLTGDGFPGYDNAVKLVFNRDGGTDTDTPDLYGLEIHYIHAPDATKSFVFLIDITATAEARKTTTEAIITELQTVIGPTTLSRLLWRNTTYYVWVTDYRFDAELVFPPGQRVIAPSGASSYRKGVMSIVLSEMIQ